LAAGVIAVRRTAPALHLPICHLSSPEFAAKDADATRDFSRRNPFSLFCDALILL
jgi:hypothetical protein